MPERKEARKFTFTVEGETEKWYLDWLGSQINSHEKAKYKVAIVAKVQQNPSKFAKSQTAFATPTITHICDMESSAPEHIKKFMHTIDQIDKANKLGKKIKYSLGYSNFTFELWISLHKTDCNAPLSHRSQYLQYINRAFGENFEDLDHYKKETNFKHCLSQLTLDDVKSAIAKARNIMENNASDHSKKLVKYKDFAYYQDNPALNIWEAVGKILKECGV